MNNNKHFIKHIIIIACILFPAKMMASNFNIECNKADSTEIVTLLEEAKSMPSSTNWMLFFARKMLGRPYVGHTLDLSKEENLVVNMRQFDCTTLVETVMALGRCACKGKTELRDYTKELREIRYIEGKVSYTARQHYFTTWIEANAKQGIVAQITPTKADIAKNDHPFTATQVVKANYMTSHISNYKMLAAHKEWVQDIKKMEAEITGKKYPYIPKASLKPTKENNRKLKKYIKDGDVIAILTSIAGLDTSHIGIAVWHNDGLHLLNASSIHNKVVEEPMLMYDYMQKHPRQLGIRVCRATWQ